MDYLSFVFAKTSPSAIQECIDIVAYRKKITPEKVMHTIIRHLKTNNDIFIISPNNKQTQIAEAKNRKKGPRDVLFVMAYELVTLQDINYTNVISQFPNIRVEIISAKSMMGASIIDVFRTTLSLLIDNIKNKEETLRMADLILKEYYFLESIDLIIFFQSFLKTGFFRKNPFENFWFKTIIESFSLFNDHIRDIFKILKKDHTLIVKNKDNLSTLLSYVTTIGIENISLLYLLIRCLDPSFENKIVYAGTNTAESFSLFMGIFMD